MSVFRRKFGIFVCILMVLLWEPRCSNTTASGNGSLAITNDDSGRIAKNVILIIGDGMNLSHEIAGSRYIYGTDLGLSFHSFDYKNYVTTWDVSTYNKYAAAGGERPYAEGTFPADNTYSYVG